MKMKTWAVACLAAALCALAMSFWFSQQAVTIQGPSALTVLGDRSVWLAVDESLWQISPDGRLLSRRQGREAGWTGRVGNMAVDAGGHLVLGIRGQEALQVFDPQQGRVVRPLTPQWPASLAQHASRAISYAFSPGGQLAIATGGGHAVALFDATGQFLRRSPPGLYQFTNGLWWQGDTLWTTNTNGFELIALSPDTMTPTQTLALRGKGRGLFLGMALASHGKAAERASSAPPSATVVRFTNGMVSGRIVDVFPDGSEREFQDSAGMEPRDMAWQGDRLLAVDGASFAIRQFGDDGQALPDFGDAQVRTALSSLAQDKARFQSLYHLALYLAVGLFLAGFVLATRAARQEQRAAQGPVITPEKLGIPMASRWNLLRKSMLFVPVWLLLAGLVWLAWPFGTPGWLIRFIAPMGRWGGLGVAGLAGLIVLLYLRFALGWAGARLDWEPVVNLWALQSLSRPELASVLEPGEVVRETLVLVGFPVRWVVLTQRRVLVFSVNRRDRTLRQAIENVSVSHVSLHRWPQLSWPARLHTLWNAGAARLEVQVQGQAVLSGYVTSVTTAERMVALLTLQMQRPGVRKLAQRRSAAGRDRAWGSWPRQVLASALVPGLGQWMQRRPGTALILFLSFSAVLLTNTVPLLWTLQGPRAAVSVAHVVSVLAGQGLVAAIAAWDCWNMRRA